MAAAGQGAGLGSGLDERDLFEQAATRDGDYSQTHAGDVSDTSRYPTDRPAVGISTGTYIQNMMALIDYLDRRR